MTIAIHDLVIRIAAKQEELQGLAQLRQKVEANLQKLVDGLEWIATDRENLSGEKIALERKRQELEFELDGIDAGKRPVRKAARQACRAGALP